MKKNGLLLSICFTVIFLASCATSKEARNYKNDIDGKWQLQTVVTEGIAGNVKAQLLNEAALSCFIGSSWVFNRNNSLGSFSINQNAGECVAVKRNLRWSIYEAKDQPKLFQFKKLDDKLKEVDEGTAGYRFTIVKLDNTNMQLRNDVMFEGRQASFIYNFIKN
jgi:Lipocalin-like domain